MQTNIEISTESCFVLTPIDVTTGAFHAKTQPYDIDYGWNDKINHTVNATLTFESYYILLITFSIILCIILCLCCRYIYCRYIYLLGYLSLVIWTAMQTIAIALFTKCLPFETLALIQIMNVFIKKTFVKYKLHIF